VKYGWSNEESPIRTAMSRGGADLVGCNWKRTGFRARRGGTALIVGTVTDATGAAVPQAAVSVRSVETGLTREVQADSDGSYRVPLLPVGAYEITAEKMGFRREVRRGSTWWWARKRGSTSN
jgi:hypothetical protein